MLRVVIYRINEFQPKNRITRRKHDVNAVLTVLSNVDPVLSRSSIQDLHHLGKFNVPNPKSRPPLVKFLHTFDVTSILSNRSLAEQLSQCIYELDGDQPRKEPTRNVLN